MDESGAHGRSGRRGKLLTAPIAICAAVLSVNGARAFESLDFATPGAPAALAAQLRASSLLVAAKEEGRTDPQDILASARADYSRLIGALYAAGYYGGVIDIRVNGREAASIAPLEAPASIGRVAVTVTPGPNYLFSQTRVQPLAPGSELPPGFAPGLPARTTVIENAAAAALGAWRDDGRAMARVGRQRIVADHARRQVAASVTIFPGPTVRFGEFRLAGNGAVRPDRIREIAGFPIGEIYAPDKLKRSADRLRRTGAFRSVAITEDTELGDGNTLDVEVLVSEAKPRRFGFGAEISSVEGTTLSGFWLHRNLRGGAERLRIDGEIAGIAGDTGGTDYSLGARFDRPGTFAPDTGVFAIGELAQENEPTYTSQTVEFGAGVSRVFSERLTAEAGATLRASSIDDALGTTDYRLLTFPVSATWERRNDALDPTDGFFMDAELRPFVGLSGTASGARLTYDARAYQRIPGNDRFVFAARVQLGSIVGAGITETPNDYRFYSGGGGTVRGKDYQSLDVDLGGGVRSGGRSFLGLSAELRGGVTDKISLVGFVDWGRIGAGSLPGGTGASHSGAGFGLRYDTGIGPLRIDFATPVSGSDGGGDFYIYIGIGQAF